MVMARPVFPWGIFKVSGRIEARQGIILGKSARWIKAKRARKPGFGHIKARQWQQKGVSGV
jgi:hypothetical protein